jgi:ClpP class serine protease
VFASHEDHSEELKRQGVKVSLISAGKYKTEANPLEPLSDSARAEIQSKVDAFFQMFIKCVALARRDTQANVRNGYGQGRCVTALDAVRMGLADRVGTLDDVLARLGVNRPGMALSGGARMDAPEPEEYMHALARRQHQLDRAGAGLSALPTMEEQILRRRRLALNASTMEEQILRRRRMALNSGVTGGASAAAPKSVAMLRRQLELDLMKV